MAGYLLDSIAKGAQIGALGRKSYEARKASERAEEDRKARGELASVLATDPTLGASEMAPSAPAIPEAEAGVGAPATDPGQQPALAAGEAGPSGPALPEAEAGVGTSATDPEYQKKVASGTADIAKRKGMTTLQWNEYRRKLLSAAAKTGDPDAVAKANKYVTDMQHKGFIDNFKMASVFMNTGDMKKAKTYLEKAYDFFPDGSSGEFAITPDGKTIVMKPTDEVTGEPRPIIALNKKVVGDMLSNLLKPENFSQMNWERQQAEAKTAYDKTRDEKEDTRNERTDKRLELNAAAQRAASYATAAKAKFDMALRERSITPGTKEYEAAQAELARAVAVADKARADADKASLSADTAATASRAAASPEGKALAGRERRAEVEGKEALARQRKMAAALAEVRKRNLGDKSGWTIPKLSAEIRKTMELRQEMQREAVDYFEKDTPEYSNAQAAIDEVTTYLSELQEERAGRGEYRVDGRGGSGGVEASAIPDTTQRPAGRGNPADNIPTLTPAEAAKLPSGSKFKGSDGKIRTKR